MSSNGDPVVLLMKRFGVIEQTHKHAIPNKLVEAAKVVIQSCSCIQHMLTFKMKINISRVKVLHRSYYTNNYYTKPAVDQILFMYPN